MSAPNDIVEDEFDFEAEDADYEDSNAPICEYLSRRTWKLQLT